MNLKQIAAFQQQLLTWFEKHGRKNLPWQGTNAYHVWVSEIMLQQTQVIKVIDYFNRFINNFPTIQTLAKADTQQVLQLWSGLGYYNRAKNLHKTAIICYQQYNAKLPTELALLMALPGIGRTTAGAILSLASNKSYPILDGNVKRVMSRVFTIKHDKISALNNKLWDIVKQLISQDHARYHNQALMDLGAMICVRSKPLCQQCPFNRMCLAYKKDQIRLFPQRNKANKQLAVSMYAILVIKQGKIYLQQRDAKGIWPELWFLPVFESMQQLELFQQQGAIKADNKKQFVITHVLSHRILTITVTCMTIEKHQITHGKWVKMTGINDIAHPKSLEKILDEYHQQIVKTP